MIDLDGLSEVLPYSYCPPCPRACFYQITTSGRKHLPTILSTNIDIRMSREVQLQADVGSLGLQGFGAFTSILATLSADNIVPMALIQMKNLGTNIPVNGEYA